MIVTVNDSFDTSYKPQTHNHIYNTIIYNIIYQHLNAWKNLKLDYFY